MKIQRKFDWNIVYRSGTDTYTHTHQVKHFLVNFCSSLHSLCDHPSTLWNKKDSETHRTRFVLQKNTWNVECFKRVLSCSISDVFIYDNLNSEMLYDDKWFNVGIFNEMKARVRLSHRRQRHIDIEKQMANVLHIVHKHSKWRQFFFLPSSCRPLRHRCQAMRRRCHFA